MATAQMPKTVRVGTHAYAVLRKSNAQMPEIDGAKPHGCCDFDNLQILIAKGLRKSKAKEFLLHEILHACTYPSFNGNTKMTDEDFVTAVAPVLLQVMTDNPELVEYLTQ